MAEYPFFPRSTIEKMKKRGLSEKDILDVWFNGKDKKLPGGTLAKVRKYLGYEIGLTYARSRFVGEKIITGVWRRERR